MPDETMSMYASKDDMIADLKRKNALLRAALDGATHYLEWLNKDMADFPFSLFQLRPINEMLPIWREALEE